MSGRAGRHLADHSHTSPDQITAEALRDSCLYLKNATHSSRAASPIALGGIKFCYDPTRKRAWSTLPFVHAPREQKLPVILRREEGHTILAHLTLLR
jgi:hypothetical protein